MILKSKTKILKILDLMVILIIVFSFLTTTITSYLAVYDKPDPKFTEVNPVAAKVGDYKQSSRAYSIIKSFLFRIFLWAILVGTYIYLRNTIKTKKMLYFLTVTITFLFFAYAIDFFIDLGYLLGVLF